MRPVNPYAVAKAAQDLFAYAYFVAYGLPIVRVRAFNHFGPRQRPVFVVADFAHQIAEIEAGLAEPVLWVGNLAAERDFLPVEDMVLAYLAVAERGRPGVAYNTGSGRGRSIRAILDGLLAHARRPIQVEEDPARMRPADVPILVGDIARVRADTGWHPRADFDEALLRTLDYARTMVQGAQRG
jgi:GDP-4-dehydro-6-deoxy-D-mannose reductase